MPMKYTAKNMWKSCFRKAGFKSYNEAIKRAENTIKEYISVLCVVNII